MKIIFIKNNLCPFCSKQLKYSHTICPENITLPCLECSECKVYFYKRNYYDTLKNLAQNYRRKLNHDVYVYEEVLSKKKISNKSLGKKKANTLKPLNDYGCIYNINDLCLQNECKYHYHKCAGSLFCDKYEKYSKNICQISIEIVNKDVILKLYISDVNNESFIKNKSSFIFNYKNYYSLTKVRFRLIFSTWKKYINFLFNRYDESVYKKDDMLIVTMKNPKEILKISRTPFNSIPKFIEIKKEIKHDGGFLYCNILIPKETLFHLIRNSCAPKTKNIKIIKQKSTIKQNKSVATQEASTNIEISKENVVKPKNVINTTMKEVGITAIILSDNRKCTYDSHNLIDVQAELRVVLGSGNVINYFIPAAYCAECDEFFVLKSDFLNIRKVGIVLCPVEDRTYAYLNSHKKNTYYGNESLIHQLGYNVIKKYDYTDEQRQIILANIMENTSITKHELESHLNRCINQHKNSSNYKDAVRHWRVDLEFVSKYNLGDLPQVKIIKLTNKRSRK